MPAASQSAVKNIGTNNVSLVSSRISKKGTQKRGREAAVPESASNN